MPVNFSLVAHVEFCLFDLRSNVQDMTLGINIGVFELVKMRQWRKKGEYDDLRSLSFMFRCLQSCLLPLTLLNQLFLLF
jgi:hypothetical protein